MYVARIRLDFHSISYPESSDFLTKKPENTLGTRLTSTKNEWNAQNAIWSRAFGPSITRNFITRVLTTQSIAMEQKRKKNSSSQVTERYRPHSVTFGYC